MHDFTHVISIFESLVGSEQILFEHFSHESSSIRIAQQITKLSMDTTFYDHKNFMILGICMRNDGQSELCV